VGTARRRAFAHPTDHRSRFHITAVSQGRPSGNSA
jgi:hypothetical protein